MRGGLLRLKSIFASGVTGALCVRAVWRGRGESCVRVGNLETVRHAEVRDANGLPSAGAKTGFVAESLGLRGDGLLRRHDKAH